MLSPYTHSACFQATEIQMSVKMRLVTDLNEVSATSGEPETVGGSYSTPLSSTMLRGKVLCPLYAHVSAGVMYRLH